MNLKLKKYLLMKSNLQLILNTMVPGDRYMPCYTKAVKIETILKKFHKSKLFINLIKKKINLNEKENWDNCVAILGNNILEDYFTSNLVIKALDLRKKKYLCNKKKESLTKLLKKVKYTKKKFII